MSKISKLLCKVSDRDLSTALIIWEAGVYRAYPPDFCVFDDGGEPFDTMKFGDLRAAIKAYGNISVCNDDTCTMCLLNIRKKRDLKGSYLCI